MTLITVQFEECINEKQKDHVLLANEVKFIIIRINKNVMINVLMYIKKRPLKKNGLLVIQ
jgi:hypothetical protein